MKLILISVFSLVTFNVSASEMEIVLQALEKISDKQDSIMLQISGNSSRLSGLESWREQQVININRFHEITFANAERRINSFDESISKIEQQLAELEGLFKIFSFIAFFLNLVLPLCATWFFNERFSKDKEAKNFVSIVTQLDGLRKEFHDSRNHIN